MCDNPNLDLVNIIVYTKFGKVLSICSQDIERKRNYDDENNGWNDGQPKSSKVPHFRSGAIIIIAFESLGPSNVLRSIFSMRSDIGGAFHEPSRIFDSTHILTHDYVGPIRRLWYFLVMFSFLLFSNYLLFQTMKNETDGVQITNVITHVTLTVSHVVFPFPDDGSHVDTSAYHNLFKTLSIKSKPIQF